MTGYFSSANFVGVRFWGDQYDLPKHPLIFLCIEVSDLFELSFLLKYAYGVSAGSTMWWYLIQEGLGSNIHIWKA